LRGGGWKKRGFNRIQDVFFFDKYPTTIKLVGGFNPFEKYESNWKSSPSRDENDENIGNHHLDKRCNTTSETFLKLSFFLNEVSTKFQIRLKPRKSPSSSFSGRLC